MADAKLNILINAKDHASGVLGGLKNVLGGLAVAGAAVAGAAVAGLTVALKDSVNAAMEAEAIQSQLAAVLKSTGGAAGVTVEMVNGLADSLSKVTKFEDDAIVAGENMLLTFTGIGKDVFPDVTKAMLDMSQAMGQDLKTTAIQLGKALNNPAEGLTALTRVGVRFTEEQEKMVKALVEAGDIAGAQKIILKELQTEFGGSAEAAGNTFAGKLEILKNRIGNVKEAIGGALIPILTRLMDKVITPLLPKFESFIGKITKFLDYLSGGGKVQTLEGLFIRMFGGEVTRRMQPFIDGLKSVYELARMLVTGDFRGGIFGLMEDSGLIIGLLDLRDGVMNLFSAIMENTPMVMQTLQGMWDFLVETFQNAFPQLLSQTGNSIGTLGDIWRNHGETVMSVIDTTWRFVVATVTGALQLVSGIVQSLLTGISGMMDAWSLAFRGDWKGAWEKQKQVTTLITLQILATIRNFMNTALSVVGTNLQEFLDVWQGNFDMAGEIVSHFVSTAVSNINAGLSAFNAAGRALMQALINGIISMIGVAKALVSQLLASIPDWMLALLGLDGGGGSSGGGGGGSGGGGGGGGGTYDPAGAALRTSTVNYNLTVLTSNSSSIAIDNFNAMRALNYG